LESQALQDPQEFKAHPDNSDHKAHLEAAAPLALLVNSVLWDHKEHLDLLVSVHLVPEDQTDHQVPLDHPVSGSEVHRVHLDVMDNQALQALPVVSK
jgi:hypothetical protein